MIVQSLEAAVTLILTLQMLMLIWSSETSLRAAYADSWRKTGTALTHLFQIQAGPDRRIGVVAFGLVGFYVAITAAIEFAGHFAH
ncbi:hypothetical protein Bcep1808_7405 (plasmid) [Burkholderia vietnamiensis G4]|uniref:Uncharacterized protein n=1 Tax=Burkholderia vietnamiensis (strain G4 / LMG 22486) TaxID=269482 RepID=A4JVH9_BURVG|nr:hypothetical protein Bcep1808_7405 [Burkholderia vietnamiensis G4]